MTNFSPELLILHHFFFDDLHPTIIGEGFDRMEFIMEACPSWMSAKKIDVSKEIESFVPPTENYFQSLLINHHKIVAVLEKGQEMWIPNNRVWRSICNELLTITEKERFCCKSLVKIGYYFTRVKLFLTKANDSKLTDKFWSNFNRFKIMFDPGNNTFAKLFEPEVLTKKLLSKLLPHIPQVLHDIILSYAKETDIERLLSWPK